MEKNYTYEYPRPALTTDCVIFGFNGQQLHVLLIERGQAPFKGDWALPGGFLKENETVEECAKRELEEETGLKEGFYLEQFHVFSRRDRDPREHVVTVAFLALVRMSDYNLVASTDAADVSWWDVEALPTLAFDHRDIVKEARQHLKDMLQIKPLVFNLLNEKFRMSELQRLYELINGTSYDRRNFQRKIRTSEFLTEEGIDAEAQSLPRPAMLFSFDSFKFEESDKEDKGNPFRL